MWPATRGGPDARVYKQGPDETCGPCLNFMSGKTNINILMQLPGGVCIQALSPWHNACVRDGVGRSSGLAWFPYKLQGGSKHERDARRGETRLASQRGKITIKILSIYVCMYLPNLVRCCFNCKKNCKTASAARDMHAHEMDTEKATIRITI